MKYSYKEFVESVLDIESFIDNLIETNLYSNQTLQYNLTLQSNYRSWEELIRNNIYRSLQNSYNKMFQDGLKKYILLEHDGKSSVLDEILKKAINSDMEYEIKTRYIYKKIDSQIYVLKITTGFDFKHMSVSKFFEQLRSAIKLSSYMNECKIQHTFIFLNRENNQINYQKLNKIIERSSIEIADVKDFLFLNVNELFVLFGKEDESVEFFDYMNSLKNELREKVFSRLNNIFNKNRMDDLELKTFNNYLSINSKRISLKLSKLINADFEKSFKIILNEKPELKALMLQSEWYYHEMINGMVPKSIELTFIVTGYLKLVEQLFAYLITRLNLRAGLPPINLRNKGTIDFKELDDYNDLMATMGDMINYVDKNGQVFSKIHHKDRFISDLHSWTKYVRNGNFHKKNILLYQQIIEIREKCIILIKSLTFHLE